MKTLVGHVRGVFRYPVKSMAGQNLDSASLGWHGLEGDRRFAFRRLADRGSFPWLTASRLPELLLYQPLQHQGAKSEQEPTHIRTPAGLELGLFDEALSNEIAVRQGGDVELMHLRAGIFDEATVSVIALGTMQKIAGEAGIALDVRRFRPNIAIETVNAEPFEEDHWVGRMLEFGADGPGPTIAVTMRDKRCVMLNLDPDTAEVNPLVMNSVVRMTENYAGVYGTVVGTGKVHVGQPVWLRA